MIVSVIRIYNCSTYCISHVYADGEYICDGLEDTDRMLDQSQSLEYIKAHKVYGQTAIPTGYYKLTLDVVSPKYSKSKFYMDLCKGKVPRILNVPAYDGVLIHAGNTAEDTAGCLLVGYNKEKGKVLNSKLAFEKLYKLLLKHKNEEIYIKYTRLYKK